MAFPIGIIIVAIDLVLDPHFFPRGDIIARSRKSGQRRWFVELHFMRHPERISNNIGQVWKPALHVLLILPTLNINPR
jgi:hypothetical protein